MASSIMLMRSLFLIPCFLSFHVSAKIVLEDGYTVDTIIDGHKLKINPYMVLPRFGSSDLVILDSSNSTLYTVQFPVFQDSAVRRFSGGGSSGYSDGDVGSARFDKPRSFAVDFKGNVYVADRKNFVIRKISGAVLLASNGQSFNVFGSSLGVTTIAGGLSNKSGNKDGPAQNATFSSDFELAFVPSICALLVSDRGNQLVRQINLKEEDCSLGSKTGLGGGVIWTLGLVLSCLLGIIIGIVVCPYIIHREGSRHLLFLVTWKHCLVNLGKEVPIICYAIKSAAVSCNSSYTLLKKLWNLSLSQLLLMFKINKVASPRPRQESVPLIDLDSYSCDVVAKSSKYEEQLKDLISFNEGDLDATNKAFSEGYGNIKQANMSFADTPKDRILLQGSSVGSSGLVKRR